VSATLERRVLQLRSHALQRAWAYRQRRLALGTWYRLRRVVVDAAEAYAVPSAIAARLLPEGGRPDPVRHELSPAKTIVWVDADSRHLLDPRWQIPVSLGPELLAAPCVALIAFERPSR
jgi:hypothetical protein